MTVVLGADPDQLESTALRVHARADDYENANNSISFWLRRMDWHGPEAERFQAVYQSQMRPQLDAAAAFLRQAAAELRTQAAAQVAASEDQSAVGWICGTPLLPGGGLPVPRFDDAGNLLGDIWEFGKDVLGGVLDIDTLVGVGYYLARHLGGLPGLRPGIGSGIGSFVPYVVDRLDDIPSIGKVLGKYGSKALGVVGIGISLWSIPGDVRETFADGRDLSEALTAGDWGAAAESLEQFVYSFSDIPIDMGGVLFGAGLLTGNPYLAAAGTGLLVAGGAMKLGAFAFDHLRDPIAEGLKNTYDFVQDAGQEAGQWLSEETRGIRREMGEGVSEIGREAAEGYREIREADGVVETVFETGEAVVETGVEAIEAGVETGIEFGKKGIEYGLKAVTKVPILNWRPW